MGSMQLQEKVFCSVLEYRCILVCWGMVIGEGERVSNPRNIKYKVKVHRNSCIILLQMKVNQKNSHV